MTMYPTVRPSLTLDFQKSKQLDPRISFSRSSSATYVEGGVVKTTDEHQARFEDEGLLLEESRTNHCLHSDIDPTNWTQNGTSSLAVSSIPAPDGGTCYDLTTDNSGTNTVRQINNTTAPVGTSVVSVFARFPNAGFTSLSLRNFAATGGANFYASYIPATDSWSAEVNCTGLPSEDFGNGWKRLTIVSTVSSSSGTNWILIGGGISTPAYTQQTCQIWGAQLEQGSFSTSYIPTAGSTVTRAADVCTIAGDNFSSWYNQSEGTIVTGHNTPTKSMSNSSAATQMWSFNDGSSANRIHTTQSVNSQISYKITAGGTTSARYNDSVWANLINVDVKSAMAYATDNVNWAYQGILQTADTNAVMPTGINKVNIGANLNGLHTFTGHISRLSYYPERVTDTQLEAITS